MPGSLFGSLPSHAERVGDIELVVILVSHGHRLAQLLQTLGHGLLTAADTRALAISVAVLPPAPAWTMAMASVML